MTKGKKIPKLHEAGEQLARDATHWFPPSGIRAQQLLRCYPTLDHAGLEFSALFAVMSKTQATTKEPEFERLSWPTDDQRQRCSAAPAAEPCPPNGPIPNPSSLPSGATIGPQRPDLEVTGSTANRKPRRRSIVWHRPLNPLTWVRTERAVPARQPNSLTSNFEA